MLLIFSIEILKNAVFIECKMDLSVLVPKVGQTLIERFEDLKDANVKIEPYDGDVSQEGSLIVDEIIKRFHQDLPTYDFQYRFFFRDQGNERVLAHIRKTEACDLYQRGVDVANDLKIPVFESPEDFRKYSGDKIEGLSYFSSDLCLIEGRPEGFNGGLDSNAHFFVLPCFNYVTQDVVQEIMRRGCSGEHC